MEYFILIMMILLLLAYFFAYFKDWKKKRLVINAKTLFMNPISLVILWTFFSSTIDAVKNSMINQNKYLTDFNNKRSRIGIPIIPPHFKLEKKLFSKWQDYFSSVKHNYQLELHSNDKNDIHLNKLIVVDDDNILYETDRYQFGNRILYIEYKYKECQFDYSYYLDADIINSSSIVSLKESQMQDTLKAWKTASKAI